MKTKIIFSLISLYLMFTPDFSLAQNKSTPEERAKQWTEWMKAELKLDTTQLSKVQVINLKYAQQTELIKSKDENQKTKFEELKAKDKMKDAELKPVFTEVQFNSYLDKKRAKQKEMLQEARQ